MAKEKKCKCKSKIDGDMISICDTVGNIKLGGDADVSCQPRIGVSIDLPYDDKPAFIHPYFNIGGELAWYGKKVEIHYCPFCGRKL